MREIFQDALKEVVQSVLPISLVVLLIQIFLVGSPPEKIAMFLLTLSWWGPDSPSSCWG